jgi:hypothetical protein
MTDRQPEADATIDRLVRRYVEHQIEQVDAERLTTSCPGQPERAPLGRGESPGPPKVQRRP